LIISFPELSATEAGRDAAVLEEGINQVLRDQGIPIAAQQQRLRPDAMDLGTYVSVVLGAKATVALFKGIAVAIQRYMAASNRPQITIEFPDGRRLTLTNADSRDVAKVLKMLQ
jgi:hypothetical protein